MLSDKEYISGGGLKCPYCGGDEITGGAVDIGGGGATQVCSCGDCGKEWSDLYTLTEIIRHAN